MIFIKTEKHNPSKKHKMLIIFDVMIVDMLSNIKLNQLNCLLEVES